MPIESIGYSHFIDQSKKAIKKELNPSFSAQPTDLHIFNHPEDVRYRIDFALRRAIENLDDELFRFENNYLNNSNKILWAGNYEDVFYYLKKTFKESAIETVVFSQQTSPTISKFYKEIGLEHFLTTHHIHQSDTRGIRLFYVDTIISETGSLLLNGMNNNALKFLNSRGINIFFTTINNVLGSVNNAEVLNEYKKQSLNSHGSSTILTRGGRRCQNYLIILDNSRLNILADKNTRLALTCIDCGKCVQVCPVSSVATPQAYDNVYEGPIGNVLLPYLESTDTYRHVAYACTLCGRCEEICPLHLPLRDMMLSIRRRMFELSANGKEYRNLLKLYRHYISNRGSVGMNGKALIKKLAFNSFIDNGLHRNREIPPFEAETFNRQYQKQR